MQNSFIIRKHYRSKYRNKYNNKVDVTDMASIIQTFERYDYKIKARFKRGYAQSFYQDRLDSF